MSAPQAIMAYADHHGPNHRTYHYCEGGAQREFELTRYIRADLAQELVTAVYQANEAHPSVEALDFAENRLASAVAAIEPHLTEAGDD